MGIFAGTLIFGVAVGWFPVINRLYQDGSLGVSVLPTLLHLPVSLFVLLVVLMAAGAFVGAEQLEARFRGRYEPVALGPAVPRGVKFALTGVLAVVALASLAWKGPARTPEPRRITAITPLELAERIVGRDRTVMVLDLRTARPDSGPGIPGAIATDPAVSPAGLEAGVTAVLYDETGAWTTVPLDWPAGPTYRYLAGGFAAWRAEVLAPVGPAGGSLDDQAAWRGSTPWRRSSPARPPRRPRSRRRRCCPLAGPAQDVVPGLDSRVCHVRPDQDSSTSGARSYPAQMSRSTLRRVVWSSRRPVVFTHPAVRRTIRA